MKFKNSLVLMILLAFVVMFVAIDSAQAYTVKQQWSRFSAVAGEALVTGDVVALKDADGLAYKASAADATIRPVVGIVGKGAAANAKVEIITSGIISGWTSLAEGQPGYLSGTAGAITQTAPVYAQQVGVAINTTDYFINLQPGISALKGYALDTDNVVLASADCGKVRAIATDAKTYTLPATIAGCQFTFINAGANGNNILELVPNAADQIFGTVTLAASVVVVAGSAGEHVVNTKATAKRGDSITLIGDGADGWYISASTGIWAEATP